MTPTEPMPRIGTSPLPGLGTLRRVRFVPQADAGQEALLAFLDPSPHVAVCVGKLESDPSDGLDVLVVTAQPGDQPATGEELFKWVAESAPLGTPPPVAVIVHGAQIVLGASTVAIAAAEDRVESFLLAVIDFCYYERELRTLEREVRENWPLLQQDSAIAHSVTESDPDRFEEVGRRMRQAIGRRVRLARLVPHLYQPRSHLPPLANQLVDRLRERAHVEDRHEALAGQLEVAERIYEMTSQRISDYTTAAQGRTLEWVIIVILAAEALLLLADLLWLMGV